MSPANLAKEAEQQDARNRGLRHRYVAYEETEQPRVRYLAYELA